MKSFLPVPLLKSFCIEEKQRVCEHIFVEATLFLIFIICPY